MKKFLIVLIFPTLLGESLFAAEAGMPQLNPEYWASQAFWLIIIFLSIYILIARIFIPKIKSNLDMRESKIRRDLEEAKTFREEAEKKLKAYKNLGVECMVERNMPTFSSLRKDNRNLLFFFYFIFFLWPSSYFFRKRLIKLIASESIDLIHCNLISLFLKVFVRQLLNT